MKMLLSLVVLGAVTYLAHDYFTAEEPIIPAITQAPASRLAPKDIYFITERYSEVTDSGVRALLPGARVRQLSSTAEGTTKAVNDHGEEFEVPSRILTQDLDVRDALLLSIADNHAKVQKHIEDQDIVAKHQKDARVAEKARTAQELQLKLAELQVQHDAAQRRVQLESGRSQERSLTGGAMAEERTARAKLTGITTEMEKIQSRLASLSLEIRREEFGRHSP